MSDSTSGRNFKALSDVTKRLISGPKVDPEGFSGINSQQHQRAWTGAFLTQISDVFGVNLTTRNKPHDVHFRISGQKNKAEAVYTLLTLLDQHAGIIAREKRLQSPRDITAIEYGLVKVYLKEILHETKSALTDELTKIKEAKIKKDNAPAATEVVAQPVPAVAQDFTSATDAKKKVANLTIPLKDNFVPRNKSQATGYLAMKDDDVSIVFLAGPAGGGKTYPALRSAFELYNEKKVDSILMFRPRTVTGSEKFGATPGKEEMKMAPYLKALSRNIVKITGKKLSELKMIESLTPDFERGETYDRSVILVDEAQNLTINEAELLVTRIGEGAKIIFAGDIGGRQNDLRGQFPGLAHLIASLGGATRHDEVLASGIAFVRYIEEDTAARHKLMPNITKALGNLSAEYNEVLTTVQRTRQNPEALAATEKGLEIAKEELTSADQWTRLRYENTARNRFSALYGEFAPKPELRARGDNVVALHA